MKERNISILIISWIVFSFFLLGLIFPEALWATHTLGLFSFPWNICLIILAMALLTADYWWPTSIGGASGMLKLSPRPKVLVHMLLAVTLGFLFYQFPIALDTYGDAHHIRQNLNLTISQWDDRLITEFLKPDWLNTKVGLESFFQFNNLFTWISAANGEEVLPVLEAVVGGLFIWLWLSFVDGQFSSVGWKWLFALIGLCSPLILVFMGHYEAYYLTYIATLIWWMYLARCIRKKQKRDLILLPLVFLLVLQSHITLWLLLPSLAMTLAWYFQDRFPFLKKYLNWRMAWVYVGVPVLVVAAIAYFFIYANHDGPRIITKEDFENNLFLPLYTPEPPPYDRYFLQSPAHLLDYLNLMYMWSGALIFLALPLLTFLRKKVNWQAPMVLISGFSSLIFLFIFFILNPLLGMVSDWDLYSIPAWTLLALLVFIYGQLAPQLRLRAYAGPVLSFCLLGAVFLYANTQADLLARHLKWTSHWHFKTYWMGASTDLISYASLDADKEEKEARLLQMLEALKPYAVPGNDKEYANVLLELGLHNKEVKKDSLSALSFMEEGYAYKANLGTNLYELCRTHFELGNFQEAFRYSKELIAVRYPPFQQCMKMGLHIALAAGAYQEAANYAVTYLNNWGADPIITEVEYRLRTGDRIDQLAALFGPELIELQGVPKLSRPAR